MLLQFVRPYYKNHFYKVGSVGEIEDDRAGVAFANMLISKGIAIEVEALPEPESPFCEPTGEVPWGIERAVVVSPELAVSVAPENATAPSAPERAVGPSRSKTKGRKSNADICEPNVSDSGD